MQGILTVISGFSGSGKGAIMRNLLSRYDDYALSVSATTRKPREGEVHGKSYFFISVPEFEEMIEDGKLIEYANYVGNYYGTPREYVEQKLAEGKNVLLEIECQGAAKIREQYPGCLTIFVTAPEAKEIKNRLLHRGTETMEQINKRLTRAIEECDVIKDYDYLVINDDINEAVELVNSLIRNSRYKVENKVDFIQTLKEQLIQQKGDN